MNNNPTPYPLAWPTGWPRTRAGERERSRFRNARAVDDQLSMSDATSRLIRECRLLGAANVIVSTNVAVRRDGLPYARQRTPEDPGAAVYFKLDSVPEGLVLACDRWLRVEDNIAAVAAHIGALRGIDRWGVGSVRQAFAGYKRLSSGDAPTPWWEVLEIDRQAPVVAVKKAYKELAKLHHPDRETGNLERFQAISKAWKEFRSFSGGAAPELADRLREEAEQAQSNEDLVRRFVEACRRTRTILPATTTIERLCADALVDAERRIEARITERVPPGLRRDLEHLLEETADAGVTRFVWLRQFEPGSNSADANRLLDRLEHLRRLDVPEGLFHEIPPHRIVSDPLNHVLGGYSRFRRYTPRMLRMLRTLDIEASPAAEPLLEAVGVPRSDGTARPTGFLRPNSKWSRLLRTQFDHRLWETAVLFHLRDAFRAGDVWLARSRRYGDIRKALLSAPAVADADRSLPVPQPIRATGSPSAGSPWTRACAGWSPRRWPGRSPAAASKTACSASRGRKPPCRTGPLTWSPTSTGGCPTRGSRTSSSRWTTPPGSPRPSTPPTGPASRRRTTRRTPSSTNSSRTAGRSWRTGRPTSTGPAASPSSTARCAPRRG